MSVKFRRLLLWAAVLGLMGAIFAFSAQEGPVSDGMTQTAVMPLAELLAQITEGGEDAVPAIYVFVGTLARKAAHMLEYGLLALLMHLLLQAYGVNRPWAAAAAAVLYAVTDELHQHFVPGRLGAATDVLIDAAGALLGAYACRLLKRICKKQEV